MPSNINQHSLLKVIALQFLALIMPYKVHDNITKEMWVVIDN
jgi:hypothetical protein